jgi:hypothetical protein
MDILISLERYLWRGKEYQLMFQHRDNNKVLLCVLGIVQKISGVEIIRRNLSGIEAENIILYIAQNPAFLYPSGDESRAEIKWQYTDSRGQEVTVGLDKLEKSLQNFAETLRHQDNILLLVLEARKRGLFLGVKIDMQCGGHLVVTEDIPSECFQKCAYLSLAQRPTFVMWPRIK